jgi:hypothetical protein
MISAEKVLLLGIKISAKKIQFFRAERRQRTRRRHRRRVARRQSGGVQACAPGTNPTQS